jgi:hypothetical protein
VEGGCATHSHDETNSAGQAIREPLRLTPPKNDGIDANRTGHVDQRARVLSTVEASNGHHDVERQDHRVPGGIHHALHPSRLACVRHGQLRHPLSLVMVSLALCGLATLGIFERRWTLEALGT